MVALGDHKKPQLGCLVGRAAGDQDLRKKSLGPMQSSQSQFQVPGTLPVSLSPAMARLAFQEIKLGSNRGGETHPFSSVNPWLCPFANGHHRTRPGRGHAPVLTRHKVDPAEVRLTLLHDHAIQLTQALPVPEPLYRQFM